MKGIDIDFIKWKVGKAEGFSVYFESEYWYISTQSSSSYILRDDVLKASFRWDLEVYPLLLQRAIEGVESQYYKIGYDFERIYKCSSNKWIIKVFKQGEFKYSSGCQVFIDQAKESALKYIYKQEIKHA